MSMSQFSSESGSETLHKIWRIVPVKSAEGRLLSSCMRRLATSGVSETVYFSAKLFRERDQKVVWPGR